MKIAFVSIYCLLGATLIGQVKPEFFPEDITVGMEEAICYCRPGVLQKTRSRGLSLTYGHVTGGGYENEGSTVFTTQPSILNKYNLFEFKLKIPVLLTDQTRVLVGYKYLTERYDFQLIGEDFKQAFQTLDAQTLKNNEYSAIVSHSFNEQHYAVVRYKYSLNGNYEGWTHFQPKYAIHSFMGLYGTKKADAFEWGLGLMFSKSFRRTTILPFLLYNRTFNFKWGIESLFPANFFLRYNLSPSAIVSFGVEYSSKSFRLLNETITPTPMDSVDYAFNHSELLISLNLERHLMSWIWGNIRVGYQRSFSNDFEAKTVFVPTFQAEPKNGLFVRIGVFVSPVQPD